MNAAQPNPAIEAQIKLTLERVKNGICVGYWIDEIALKEIFRFSDTSVDNYRSRKLLLHKKWGGLLFFDLAYIILTLETGSNLPPASAS